MIPGLTFLPPQSLRTFSMLSYLAMFSCKTRGFCPSCHVKRLEVWGEWMRETLLLDIPHLQVVFTIPKMLRSDR